MALVRITVTPSSSRMTANGETPGGGSPVVKRRFGGQVRLISGHRGRAGGPGRG